jgi:hypothetical protein
MKLLLEQELRNLGRFSRPGFADQDHGVGLGDLLQKPEFDGRKNELIYF